VTLPTTGVFQLPDRLAAKGDPALVAADERHFAAISSALEATTTDLAARLDEVRRNPGRGGTGAVDRDAEIHRLTARLAALRRFGLDLCLGRVVPADGGEAVYVGRLGLTDGADRRLLVDWRSPAAEPFFAATHADPHGLASRRRYRWTGGRITDYWDEAFTDAGLAQTAALDDQSAFIASLGASRSPRMRDVLSTIAADQDAIVRADSAGALVVDGGPGTGKTVVALHRTAYLLYADPRLGHRRGGVLLVGPHEPYLAYVEDVLPSLGEEGVRTCTVRDLVVEGTSAGPEADPEVARLKSSAAMVAAIEPAVRFSERPPAEGLLVETEWADLWLSVDDWAEAFEAPDPGTPHNEAREQVRDALVEILVDKAADDGVVGDPGDPLESGGVTRDGLTRQLRDHRALRAALNRAWPMLEATELLADLWSVPAYLRLCAPWLSREEVTLLQRDDPRAWTVSDLPLLDAARRQLGDADAAARRQRHDAAVAADRSRIKDVVDDLIATDDSELGIMKMLRHEDLQEALVDPGLLPTADVDPLAGPFAHVVVDEAQELTDAEWQMLLARCPSRSLTIVGDRAQARHGFTETWTERLQRVGLDRVTVASLTVNYRTPSEVMAVAEPVIRTALPDANVPTSIRTAGVPVRHAPTDERDAIVDAWLSAHDEGTACVIGDPTFVARDRVLSLSATLAKGLEFDLVVLVDPERFGAGIEGAVDRYVAMTRATRELVILASA